CGNRGSKNKECLCRSQNLLNYERKLSGPILDRIDLWLEVSEIDYKKLGSERSGETTDDFKERVLKARARSKERLAKSGLNILTNNEIRPKDLLTLVPLQKKVREILDQAAYKLNISARAYHRLIKVARTIADLEEKEEVEVNHMLEALQYRPKKVEI